jgi:hypothetical protein
VDQRVEARMINTTPVTQVAITNGRARLRKIIPN